MYSVSVPVHIRSCQRYGLEAMLAEVKKFDARRVFLALGYYQLRPEKRRASLESLQESCRFFKEKGFEVGAWIWTTLFEETPPFSPMAALDGAPVPHSACPLDEDFLAFSRGYLQDIARCGVDLILFDDDFRYGFLGSTPGCLCELHAARINRILGEGLDQTQLSERILSGGKNKYRDAWLQCNGDAFRAFAKNARAAVDSVNPAIRLGACACMSSWDVDGVSAPELAKILAGNTRPILRLIGAPYWAANRSWGNFVQDAVELERMESAWSRFDGLEIMAEGDAYPRPRISCPAAYLEGFDMAIRAAGCTDGIMKYGIDYCSQPGYENGYAIMHHRNRPLYAGIDRLFGGKSAAGIRVYEFAKKAAEAEIPTLDGVGARLDHLFFSQAARVLAHNAIPSTYGGPGVTGIAFGENARHLGPDAFRKGLILDLPAAKILQEKGIDTGLVSVGEKVTPNEERFLSGNHIGLFGAAAYAVTVSEKAEILSVSGDIPLSYRYENGAGQRFLVLNFCTDITDKRAYIWKHYARGQQIAEHTPWLSGERLPAFVSGSPSLYLQCKAEEGSLTVGLWNFSPDPVFAPEVRLGEAWNEAEFLNTSGSLEADRVRLVEIPPFGFAAFTVRK